MKKQLIAMGLSMVLALSMAGSAMAAGWQKNDTGWWYGTNADNTTWYANGWQWIDGNGDGTAESYYFDANGYLYTDTTTPDGYTVNADGARTENGVVQTQTVGTTGSSANTDAGAYDPEHPLKGCVEAFNLLEEPATTRGMYTAENEGHYDSYRQRYVGYNKYYLVSTLSGENHFPSWYNPDSIDEFDRNLTAEVKRFLNSFDWKNASDGEKAQKALEWVGQATYSVSQTVADLDAFYAYGCLVNKKATCDGYSRAYKLLTNVIGLECTSCVDPYRYAHASNCIKIDGQWYFMDTTLQVANLKALVDYSHPLAEPIIY